MVPENPSASTAPTEVNTSQESENKKATSSKLTSSTNSEQLKLRRSHLKIVNASEKIRQEKPKELSYGIDFLADGCFPVSDPSKDLLLYKKVAGKLVVGGAEPFTKTNGNLTMELHPSRIVQPDGTVQWVFPWGIHARRILLWVITEIRRTRQKKLYLGTNLTDFMVNKLGLVKGGTGFKAIRNQILALFRVRIEVTKIDRYGKLIVDEFDSFQIAKQGKLFTYLGSDTEDDEQEPDGFSWLLVADELYYRVLGADGLKNAKAFPVDMRAVQAIGNDALALDVYLWVVLRVFRADKGRESVTLRWTRLHEQFGTQIADIKDFRKKFRRAIMKVGLVYPGLNYEDGRKEFTILPSDLAVEPVKVDTKRGKLKATNGTAV